MCFVYLPFCPPPTCVSGMWAHYPSRFLYERIPIVQNMRQKSHSKVCREASTQASSRGEKGDLPTLLRSLWASLHHEVCICASSSKSSRPLLKRYAACAIVL